MVHDRRGRMLRKMLVLLFKTLAGVIALYLVLGFWLLPLVAVQVIKVQGSKILSHPVAVRSVQLNPLTLVLKVNGLEVRDKEKTLLVGFEQLAVDVSFKRLLRKEYVVESFLLDGLTVNARLLADGQVNLMTLVPPPKAAGGDVPGAATSVPAEQVAMPAVMIQKFRLTRGSINFEDRTVTPAFSTRLHNIDVTSVNISTQAGSPLEVQMQALLDDKGSMNIDVVGAPFVSPIELETSFKLNNYAMGILSPYVGKYTGRLLQSGKLDLKMDYRLRDNQLTASHKLLIQSFAFGQKVESKDALSLPFGLAIALLEDPQGKINVSLPVSGDLNDPKFSFWGLLGQVTRNFFMKLVTKPFAIFAAVLGTESGTDDLGYVYFQPRQTEISADEKGRLLSLVQAMKERPRLRLEINGGYDLVGDWQAIKEEALRKEFTALQKESTKGEEWAYQQIYQRYFGVRELWSLTKELKVSGLEEAARIADIKKRLLAASAVDKAPLEVLASARAQGVWDAMVGAGMPANNLVLGNVRQVQPGVKGVPLEFTLTIFDGE